jgi:hypothetical protein
MESKLVRFALIVFMLLLAGILTTTSLSALSSQAAEIHPVGSSAILTEISATPPPASSSPAAPASTVSQNVELVGQIGGPTYAVAVQDHYAYIGVGAKLVVLDISDPENPIVTGQTGMLPEIVQDVVISGTYAYLADGNSGLRVISIADPAYPFQVGFYDTPSEAMDLAVAGDTAYVADNSGGLRIIDVSDPANPRETGAWRGTAFCVAVAGQYAYVGEGSGMHVIDVSNPASPQQVGFIDAVRAIYSIATAGHYVYAGATRNFGDYHIGLWVIDVSDPAHPQVTGHAPDVRPYGVTVVGNYAYIAEVLNGLCIIDISNPSYPIKIGSHYIGNGSNVAVADGYAYVAGSSLGLHIFNVADPTNTSEVSSYDTPDDVQSVVVAGDYAYVYDQYQNFYLINVSEPANLFETGFHGVGEWTYVDPRGIAVAGRYAYLASMRYGLRILDIANPASPSLVSWTEGPVGNMTVAGNYLYIAAEGLHILNITNPVSPTEAGSYDTGSATGVAVAGNYALIANGANGLQIINVSDPAHPTGAGSCDTPGNAVDVAIAGSYAYVADGDSGLRIINVSDPAHPTEVGSYDTAGNAQSVAVVGDYAYVADGTNGLRVINVSDPAHPTESGFYMLEALRVQVANGYIYVAGNTSGLVVLCRHAEAHVEFVSQLGGYMNGVAVQDNYAYVGIGPSLVVLDKSTPSHPVVVGQTRPLPEMVQGVAVSGTYAYIVNGSNGLRIVDVTDPASPQETGAYAALDSVANGVAIAGSYAYVASMNGLHIVDVSSPFTPTLTGFISTTKRALNVAVVGHYAYVAAEQAGLQVIDVSDPASPQQVGSEYECSFDVAVAGDYVYVSDCYSGLRIMNISDPAHPVPVSLLDTPGSAVDLAIVNNTAYIADVYGLDIVDVSEPMSPTQTAYYSVTGSIRNVAVADGLAYAVAQLDGLHVVNVSNPADPHEVGVYETPLVAPQGVAIGGTFAYVTDGGYQLPDGHRGLRIFNVFDPVHPNKISAVTTPGEALGMAEAGPFVYVADGSGGLRDISVFNPTLPGEIGSVAPLSDTQDVAVVGNYAYVADGDGGLRIIKVQDPANPSLRSSYDTPESARKVAMADNYAYIADGDGGLRIVNVANPSFPTEVGVYSATGAVYDVALSGAHAYLATSDSLRILDITDPAHPTDVGSLSMYATDVEVTASGYAYVASGVSLRVVNVADPAHPTEAADYVLPSGIIDLAVTDEGYAYVTLDCDGLMILRFHPSAPAADFVASPRIGAGPLTVALTDTSTGGPNNWLWTFGDGSNSTLPNPTHTYTVAGMYTVSLRVTNAIGSDTLTRTNYIAVGGAVGAAFSASPTFGMAPLAVTFTNHSTDVYTSSLWSFGDGHTSTAPNPRHTYVTVGSFTVTLTVSGPGGSDTLTHTNLVRTYLPPPILTVPVCGTTNKTYIVGEGLAHDGFRVMLLDNGTQVFTTTDVTDNSFSFDLALVPGQHILTATATNAAGTSPASRPLTLTVSPSLAYDPIGVTFAYAAPAGAVVQHPHDPSGCANPEGWRVWLRQGYTTTVAVPVSYTTAAAVTVTLGTQTITLTESCCGTFNGTITPPIDGGMFVITITADGQTVSTVGSALIDPDGYVFDKNEWESQEITQTVAGVSVTCEVSDSLANQWTTWAAWAYDGQINPQVTSADGYYAFFVPPGTYRITARRSNYLPFTSPEIDVVDTPARLNIPLAAWWQVYLPVVLRQSP